MISAEEPRVKSAITSALMKIGVFLLLAVCASGQEIASPPDVPRNFRLDFEAAAKMRAQLMSQSVAPSGRYSSARLVFERITTQATTSYSLKFAWTLRIVPDDEFNAYASPDGTVYVESGLADVAGESKGLWAAILAHEIAHVLRRDWARRFLYQRALEGSTSTVVMGDPGIPGEWKDSSKASEEMAKFCRQLEIDADREGLMLMARAGYHPDFVPALHHLLHAQSSAAAQSLYAMHPCWEERDRELSRAYTEASIAFEHLWPDWNATPGGNPPVLVFADEPRVHKTSAQVWQIEIPMRCQNLAGAVEVVLRAQTDDGSAQKPRGPDVSSDLRQLTGCTSPKTTITFTLDNPARDPTRARWTDVYVLDSWGTVLTREDLPKLSR
jgi:hypothetical protein